MGKRMSMEDAWRKARAMMLSGTPHLQQPDGSFRGRNVALFSRKPSPSRVATRRLKSDWRRFRDEGESLKQYARNNEEGQAWLERKRLG